MKAKLKKDWMPRWRESWDRLPPRPGQSKPLGNKTLRQRPEPLRHPMETNRMRMSNNKAIRLQKMAVERDARRRIAKQQAAEREAADAKS